MRAFLHSHTRSLSRAGQPEVRPYAAGPLGLHQFSVKLPEALDPLLKYRGKSLFDLPLDIIAGLVQAIGCIAVLINAH